MKQLSVIFSFVILFFSCATITSPSGGEKDADPPKLISAKPEIGSTNFSKNSFEIRFDEFVVREDFAKEIIVSPEIKTLKSVYHGKRIKFSWDEELKENTTYTFQFLNTIKDFNENNILAGFLYTFSTGEVIDSLVISGEIINKTYESSDELKVNLVSVEDFTDSTYIDGGFNYGTFSDKEGHFKFSYLPHDSFYIYGFEDKNSNKKWDEEDERIAFFSDPIESSDSTVVVFDLFLEDRPTQFTQAKHSGFNTIELPYEDVRPEVETIELYSYGETLPFIEVEGDRKIELLFDESMAKDSLCVMVNKTDTFPLYTVPYKTPHITLEVQNKDFIKKERLVLKTNYPINQIDSSRIETRIQGDTLTTDCKIFLLEDKRTIELEFADAVLPISVIFKDSALVYQDSIYNEWFNESIVRKSLEDFAIIQCSFQSHNHPLIVQLHSDKDELLKEEYLEVGKTTVEFDRVLPGNYKLRYIVDKDGDKKFTSGSIKAFRQPEPIVKYKGSVQLKPNWITELVFK